MEATNVLPWFDNAYGYWPIWQSPDSSNSVYQRVHIEGVLLGGATWDAKDYAPNTFVPVRRGLNVVYGLNGSGKTRFLNRVKDIADGRHGPMEGLVVSDIPIGQRGRHIVEELASEAEWLAETLDDWETGWPIVRQSVLSGHAGQSAVTSLQDGNSFWNLDRIGCGKENAQILAEFLQRGSILLARGFGDDSTSTLLAVPMCLPGQRGPATRAVLENMRTSLAAIHQRYWDTHHEDLEDFRDPAKKEFYDAAEQWRCEWIESALLNRRNLGDWFDAAIQDPEEYSWTHLPLVEDDTPLFLPAIAQSKDSMPHEDSPDWNFRWRMVSDEQDRDLALQGFTRTVREMLWVSGIGSDDDVGTKAAERLNQGLGAFLPGTPPVEIDLGDARDWLRGDKPAITLGGYPVSAASNAQFRWLMFAGQLIYRQQPTLVVVDEPEAGLHRSAERAVRNALSDPERFGRTVVIVATHSPIFLQGNANLLHASAALGITGWSQDDGQTLDHLGMSRGDALLMTRIFLIVEGPHDKIVLETLFGEELRSIGVEIFFMSGVRAVEQALDSQFLLRCTDAVVMVLFDNLRADIGDVWRRARKLANTGRANDLDAARTLIRSHTKRGNTEDEWMSRFLLRSLTDPSRDRIEAFGLPKEGHHPLLGPASVPWRGHLG